MGVLQALGSIRNLVRESWHFRKTYANWSSVWEAFLLRAAVGRRGGRLVKPKTVRVRVRGLDSSVTLRRGKSDYQIFMGIFEQGRYDCVRDIRLPASAVVFDFGGNVGLASLRFSMLLPASRILVVEPDAENRAVLEGNTAHLKKDNRITVISGFVAPADGEAGIDRSGAASEYRMAEIAAGQERIPTYSIPTLMRRAGVDHVDLLKVDIEGAEAALFANCRDWIGKIGAILVEIDPPYTGEAFYSDLRQNGVGLKVLSVHGSEYLVEVVTDGAARES